MRNQFIVGTCVVIGLYAANQAQAASYFTRVTYYDQVTGTTSAQVDELNWITATPNALRGSVDDQYYYHDGNYFPYPTSQANGSISDTYTLGGPVNGAIVPVTVRFDVDYLLDILQGPGGYTYSINTQISGGAAGTGAYTVTRDASGGMSISGNPNVSIEQTINWEVGTSKDIAFSLGLFSQGTGGSGPNWIHTTQVYIDASSTAAIGFDLPAGLTMTSTLGWTPIPEPATLAFAPVALLLVQRRRRR